jgi:hypothetical protein
MNTNRKDIFYSGSLHHIPEYQAAKNECDYVAKMTIKDVETGSSNAFVEFLNSIFPFWQVLISTDLHL